jgi:hypothetical protein
MEKLPRDICFVDGKVVTLQHYLTDHDYEHWRQGARDFGQG